MKRTTGLLAVAIVLLSGYVIKLDKFPEPKFVNVINEVMPAVVDIKVIVGMKNPFTGEVQKRQVEGSGVYVNSQGFILTCGHLFNFKEIYSINITNAQGETVSGKLWRADFHRDLALVQTKYYNVVPYVQLEDPRKLKIGQEVFAIGSPAGFEFSVSNGIISGLYRDVGDMYNTLQTNTAINPGNSGGPLFNLQGKLVGIVSFFVPLNQFVAINSGLGFAVSPGQQLEFLVKCGKDIPGIRRYQWLRLLLSSLGNKRLEL